LVIYFYKLFEVILGSNGMHQTTKSQGNKVREKINSFPWEKRNLGFIRD
jgi:hypothetical protein